MTGPVSNSRLVSLATPGGVSPAHSAGAPAILSDDVAAPAEQAITNAPAPKAWKSRVPPRVYGTRSKKTPGPI